MIPRIAFSLTCCFALLCRLAAAQTPAPKPKPTTPAPTSQGYKSTQGKLERNGNRIRFIGQAEIEFDIGVTFFADEAELDTDTGVVTAQGNVVLTNAEGRISAERLEFNTRTQTGTFYQASGIISLGQKAERVQFGNQDPDIYFYGETVAKIG